MAKPRDLRSLSTGSGLRFFSTGTDSGSLLAGFFLSATLAGAVGAASAVTAAALVAGSESARSKVGKGGV